MSTPLKFAAMQEQAARDAIDFLLTQCTDAQDVGFHRIHNAAPWKGVQNIPVDKLCESYELLRRTVIQNEKTP
jgi:hypothetical protein